MKKTLLVVSGGIEAVPGIHLARQMGLHVVVSDRDPQAPGLAAAHDCLLADTYDVEGTIEAAKTYSQTVRPIDGVICIAADVPLTVAGVAAALGLPGISVESARLASDKLAMKRRFSAHGVPVPWFAPLESFEQLSEAVTQKGFPLVIKPVDSRGARGVLRLTPEVDLKWAWEFARGHSPTGRALVEQFLSGPQVSTESLVIDGVAHTIGFSDRNYEYLDRYAPHIIENGGELPSHLPQKTHRAICDVVQEAAASMGIRNGVVKGDIVVHADRPYVIELAARLSGGYFCTHEIPLNTGIELVRHAILLALGEKPDPRELRPRRQQAVVQRYLFPHPGRVVAIDGVEKVLQRPEIAFCDIRVNVGDLIGPVNCHPARAGVIIATGKTRQLAFQAALAGINEIRIRTEPPL